MFKELLKSCCLLLMCVFLNSGPRVDWISVAQYWDALTVGKADQVLVYG